MSDEHIQKEISPETSKMLQNKPQRQARRFKPGLAILFSLLGIIVIASVVSIIIWHALSSGSGTTGTSAVDRSKGSNNNSAVPPGWNDPATYWDPIRTEVARGLHLGVAQVTARLQAATPQSASTPTTSNKGSGSAPDPGEPMIIVATQQGLSIDQLRTLELGALQKGCDAMVAQGKLSQADANQRMQTFDSWDRGTLNWYIMHAFTGQ